jgi:lipoprotein-anchoring transpeptidase ErfK/SrfK
VSVAAQARYGAIHIFRVPGAKRPFVTFRNPNPAGERLTFLVVQRLNGWERVRLPMRPNGTTGWVHDRSVRLANDPYRVSVSLSSRLIRVWRHGRLFHVEKAGVGRSVLPTPLGEYYITELLKERDPSGAYGPYAFGLSAFSNVLYHFGAGPGQIGLHGTDCPAGLGTNVSHGCIRISNEGITLLAHLLPVGTPVEITR